MPSTTSLNPITASLQSSSTPRSAPCDRRWLTLAVLCLSLLVTVLDTTIVNVALPTLDRDLHASASGLEWIVDAYTLVFAGLLIFAGALGDRYGRRLALTGGLLVFGAGSVFAALSATLGELIAARAVMGAGAALVMPATLSILTGVFTDPAERAKAIGIWSAVSGLGIAIGPTLGGVLLERFSWSAIFLINIPVIAIALLAGRRLVPASRAANPPRLDLTGAVLSITGLSALTYSLIQASANGWTSSTTLLSGLAAGCLLATFAVLQLRASDPMVELRLFANPRFGGASAGITALFFALTSATFLLTQIYQFVLGYSPLAAGLRALPPALVVGVVSPLGARVAAKTGPRLPVAAGLMLATCGIGLFTTATANSGYLHYVLAMTIIALGIGLAMAPATQSIMSAVPPHKAGVGSAINDTTRNLGSVLGIAVVGSLVASAYKTGLAPASTHLSEHLVKLTGESVAAATEIAARLPGSTGHQLLSAAHHAFIHAADHGLLIAAAATLIGMLITARSLPATASARAPIGAHEQRVPANA